MAKLVLRSVMSEIILANNRIFSHVNKQIFNHANKLTCSSFQLSKRPAVPRAILPGVPAQSDRDFALFNPEKFFKPSYFRLCLVLLSTQADLRMRSTCILFKPFCSKLKPRYDFGSFSDQPSSGRRGLYCPAPSSSLEFLQVVALLVN